MSTAKFNTWQNPDGTENYKCRAWVNFNGTGTVAIRAAGNVSSITDNGAGFYTVNFTTAMQDADYCTQVSASVNANNDTSNRLGTITASAVQVLHSESAGTFTDVSQMHVAIFR